MLGPALLVVAAILVIVLVVHCRMRGKRTGCELLSGALATARDGKHTPEYITRELIDPVTHTALDRAVQKAVRAFALLDEKERRVAIRSVSEEESTLLFNFALRSSVLGLRNKDPQLLKDGLFALSMLNTQNRDFREFLTTLGLHHHSRIRLGIEADEPVREAAKLASPGMTKLMLNFANRNPEGKHLKAWGYQEEETPNGIAYRFQLG